MRILEVIPIARGINTETLSYFTSTEASIGSIVKVPLRKKTISAIVIGAREVIELKSEIKSASFSLKKIHKFKADNLFDRQFIEAAKETADYFASSIGSVISSVVPKILFEKAEKLKISNKNSRINMATHAEKLA